MKVSTCKWLELSADCTCKYGVKDFEPSSCWNKTDSFTRGNKIIFLCEQLLLIRISDFSRVKG